MGERGTEVPIAGKTLRCCSTVGNRRVRTRTPGGVGAGDRSSGNVGRVKSLVQLTGASPVSS